jgi:hypothetical protein
VRRFAFDLVFFAPTIFGERLLSLIWCHSFKHQDTLQVVNFMLKQSRQQLISLNLNRVAI